MVFLFQVNCLPAIAVGGAAKRKKDNKIGALDAKGNNKHDMTVVLFLFQLHVCVYMAKLPK